MAGGAASAVAALDHFRDQMLSLGPDPLRVLEDADAHPECALLQSHAAVLHLYGMTEAGDADARRLLARAREAGGGARERLWVALAGAWIARDYEAAMDRAEEITTRWPRDLLAAKVAEFHYYATGQHWQARRFLAHMERIAAENDDSSHFLAMHAFALELSGRYGEATALAERAIARDRITPWAHHCLAHAYVRQGLVEAGETVLRDLASTWDQSGQPIHGHNAWHLALFALARLDVDEALHIHRAHVSGFLPDSVGEQVDAISLLWRVELAGHDCSDAWSAIAEHLEPRAEEAYIPFVSAHDVYALVRAGRTEAARTKAEACRRLRDQVAGARRRVWQDVGIALVDACLAFAEGDNVRAATLLEPAIDDVGCVGGSDAQDDVFRQTHLVSLIRAGRARSARAALERLLRGHAPSPLEDTWAAQI